MDAQKTRSLAHEISAIAHGKAVHAFWPMFLICDAQRRDDIHKLLASEFLALTDTVEHLLNHHELRKEATRGEGRSHV